MAIELDTTLMFADRVPDAIAPGVWQDAAPHFADAQGIVARRRANGELGFLDLATGSEALDELRRFADGVGQAFSDVVVLGIGGSALGARMFRGALRPPGWNALSDEAREYFPRLHVMDNIDPAELHALFERIDFARTLFLVISKSGGTAETLAQYLIVRERLEQSVGAEYRRHLVFITDPERGPLREIARAEGIVSMEIPPNVGGRFSALSPAGLLPAALAGVDVAGLLEGAAAMRERCAGWSAEENPAAKYALMQWLADSELGLRNHVLMPYVAALQEFTPWFTQLWAESLGKLREDGRAAGPTPIGALGATDQHSQLQLYLEGPRDKTVTFIAVAERAVDIAIPRAHPEHIALARLGGHSLGLLIDAERRATTSALAAHKRPSMTITIDRCDAWHLGGLILMFELAAIYAGALYGVDPLDQPAVELGKRMTVNELERRASGG